MSDQVEKITSNSMLSKIIGAVFVLLILYLIYILLRHFKFFENRHITSQMSSKNTYEVGADDWCPSGAPSANFSLSIWFYVSSWNTAGGDKYILHRTDNSENDEIAVYLGESSNDLFVRFTSEDDTSTTCEVKNIPLQKWINLVLVKYGEVMDIYIDGKLIKSCVSSASNDQSKTPDLQPILLHGKYSNGEVVEQSFTGYTTHLKYYNSTLNPSQVYNIYKNGSGGSFLDSLLGGYKMRMSLLRNDEEIAGIGLG
jgi:hypothetical protein